jgi:hypothetical protein
MPDLRDSDGDEGGPVAARRSDARTTPRRSASPRRSGAPGPVFLGAAAPPTTSERAQRGWWGGLSAALTLQPALALNAEAAAESRVMWAAVGLFAIFCAIFYAGASTLARSDSPLAVCDAFSATDDSWLPVSATHVAVGKPRPPMLPCPQ